MTVGALSLPLASVLTGQPEVIGSSVLSAAAAAVSFQFPAVYRAVLVEAYIKNDANAKTVTVYLNGDSGNNYSRQYIDADGATVTGARGTAGRFDINASGIAASASASFTLLVVKSTAAAKAQLITSCSYNPATPPRLDIRGGEWSNTADLLSRIDIAALSNNFAANTSITVWGYRL